MIIDDVKGVPRFEADEFFPKKTEYCLCIPVINENGRLAAELERALQHEIDQLVDIIICDGGSTDGSTDHKRLTSLGVNTLLTKRDTGKQGAQLRMGFWWALNRGYAGVITIDGNNKDSIESVPLFIEKLKNGYDFVQGSRYIDGGKAINTPFSRHWAVKCIHAPLLSLAARRRFTDTTNAYRGHSRRYLEHPGVQPFRDIFVSYELLAYLSVRASQLKLNVCEIPVTRAYPKEGKVPTKISFFRGNWNLLKILFNTVIGKYSV
jgi:dolichol-phosphate mannosyltransferase